MGVFRCLARHTQKNFRASQEFFTSIHIWNCFSWISVCDIIVRMLFIWRCVLFVFVFIFVVVLLHFCCFGFLCFSLEGESFTRARSPPLSHSGVHRWSVSLYIAIPVNILARIASTAEPSTSFAPQKKKMITHFH